MTKTPRLSSTSSWTIRGIWNSMRLVLTANFLLRFELQVVDPRTRSVLLRVQLDDERFLDWCVDFLALRPLEHLAGQAVVVGLQPRRDRGGEVGRVAHDLLGRAALAKRDHGVGAHLVARDVDPAAVDLEVAVANELAGLRARGCEAEAGDDGVETRLEHPQGLLTCDAPAPRGPRGVVAELLLEQAVVPSRLLLLAELQQVLGLLDAAAAVLARRIAAALDRALLGQAALALEEELHALPAALLALGRPVSCH